MASSMVKEPLSRQEQPRSELYTPLIEDNEREMEELDVQRLEAVGRNDFAAAARVEARLKQLQSNAERFARAALLERQQEDCDQLEAEYARAVASIKAAYQDDIDEVDARAFELSEDLETESKGEIDRLMRHTPPPKLRFSKELLSLRDKAMKLGKKREYDEAARVQARADELEAKETAQLREKHKQKLERMYERIKKKHEEDLAALEDKAERSKLQQTKYFKIEIQRLKDKYQRLASELEHQHALERYKLSSANTSGGKDFIPKHSRTPTKKDRKPRPWDKGTPLTPRTHALLAQNSPGYESPTASHLQRSNTNTSYASRRSSAGRSVGSVGRRSTGSRTPATKAANVARRTPSSPATVGYTTSPASTKSPSKLSRKQSIQYDQNGRRVRTPSKEDGSRRQASPSPTSRLDMSATMSTSPLDRYNQSRLNTTANTSRSLRQGSASATAPIRTSMGPTVYEPMTSASIMGGVPMYPPGPGYMYPGGPMPMYGYPDAHAAMYGGGFAGGFGFPAGPGGYYPSQVGAPIRAVHGMGMGVGAPPTTTAPGTYMLGSMPTRGGPLRATASYSGYM